MNKIIIASALVAIAAMMITSVELAEAQPPIDKPFSCTTTGTFTGGGLPSTATGIGQCSHFGGEISSESTLTSIGEIDDDNCLVIFSDGATVITANNGDTANLLIDASQCFYDIDGTQVPADEVSEFCGEAEGSVHTSTVDGDYTIDGGEGRFVDAEGSGVVHSEQNHCDEQPNTDTFEMTFEGRIIYDASNRRNQ